MLGGDRTEHGRKEQHCEDGGPHLYYGTGETTLPRENHMSISPINSHESEVELVQLCPDK